MTDPPDRMERVDEDAETAEVIIDVGSGLGEQRSPYLMVIAGPSLGGVHKVVGKRMVLGRSHGCDLLVDDEGVSRQHAVLEVQGDSYVIEDLNSLNGLFVNGKRAKRHLLVNGDRIRLGSTSVLKFSLQDEFEESFQQQLYESSVRDGLTGAYNKRFFDEQMQAEFSYALRHKQPLTLVLFDIDQFKDVNDTHGHLVGDGVLRELARLLKRQLRTEDLLARYGGEEFALILRQTGLDEALVVAERLRKLVADSTFVEGTAELRITVSAGLASQVDGSYRRSVELVQAADACLYEAKRSGRNAVRSDREVRISEFRGRSSTTRPT